MRIGFVTQWFPPETGTVVPSAIAEGLRGAGHDVEVLTGFPNYPTGRVMDGYRVRPYQRETTPSGITVHRAPLWPNHDSRAVARMANYLSFAAGASAVARTRVPRPDVWLVYSSPATAVLPVVRLLRRHRAPYFLLVQDLWPDSVTGSGFVGGAAGAAVENALTRFCDATYRHAGGIGVISPGMRRVLVDRGVPDRLVHDTPNWISDDHLLPDVTPGAGLRAELGLSAGRTWMYAGNLGELQGLDALVEAFARRPEAQLVLVGDGVARGRLEALAARLGATNIRFAGSVATSEVGRWIAASDVQVVSLQDTPLLRVTMPSKVQTALAAARPVLVHAAGDAASVVTDGQCGWAANPGDAAALDSAIGAGLRSPESELEAMGRRSRGLYEEHYSPRVGPHRLARALESAVAGQRR
ncbi:Glycosyltransferase involved in cell wall bisynthesis [Nocardioides alpinus]|uniref:Glycosyltransferase WbuB n=1 Tax=Nocardioides alpinus TaxID=748909 RepID=A0A1I0WHI3_9ACTN|nr:glycosyltransferase family 4 protein [Nocardioides alpinus]PKH37929.1 glycosyltransferase WbuB [Nocardioides alpinus]SFA88024.1 Glycosyltransferase involved in cell wall bisynthesis [Nocardioides alpinus]